MDKKEKIAYLTKIDIEEKNLLIRCGYFSKVKHVLDEFSKENIYLVQTEIFRNIIGLYCIKPDDLDTVCVRWIPIYNKEV